jgi:hypothetical protein
LGRPVLTLNLGLLHRNNRLGKLKPAAKPTPILFKTITITKPYNKPSTCILNCICASHNHPEPYPKPSHALSAGRSLLSAPLF